ncbi:MAG: NifB/NifX family molybdenum-iron cluster-binding protein [Ignavibacteriaceae bacterium]|nr:NifB/NifX family molybdenum-iron cluster-binding protein [Ignavibacteriaceae bacterium]
MVEVLEKVARVEEEENETDSGGVMNEGDIEFVKLNNITFEKGVSKQMRLAVAIEERNEKELVAEHFGRCTKFNICELDAENNLLKIEEYFNPLAGQHSGACQLPGYVRQFNVNTIIAGGMGQKAIANFHSFGIDVITAPGVIFNDVIKLYCEGKLSGYETCTHGHGHEHNC